MEPTAIASVLSKLIGLGIAFHKAHQTEGATDEDLSALKAFLETGSGLLSRKSKDDKPIGAVQLALVAKSFGVAVGRHWAFSDLLVPGDSRLPRWLRKVWDSPGAARYEEIELRLKHADLKVLTLGNEPDPATELQALQRLTSSPLNTPYYQALWKAFSDPLLEEDGKEPLLSLKKEGDAREFEKYFRQAYIEALSSPEGQRVQQWHIDLASEKAAALLRGLIQDIAAWGRRHVFGNATAPGPNDVLPFMPLDDVYVEPRGRKARVDHPNSTPDPIKNLIRELLKEHRIIVVKADFGHGKSLTARSFAKETAFSWLSDNYTSGARLAAPIFVKCARDIQEPSYEHNNVVRRALWNHASDSLGIDLPMDDVMFAPPKDQELVFILDGLDEVSFAQNQRKELFSRLHEKMRGGSRAVVFTRPGALDHDCLPKDTPVVELLPFQDDTQVEAWLKGWNALPSQAHPVSLATIHSAGLNKIARVPILLLMIATTINQIRGDHEAVVADKSVLYERFFSHIAHGKLKQGGEEHLPIAQASSRLLTGLINKNILTEGARPVDAMLWLMSRVAWKAHEYAYRPGGRPLRVEEVKVYILEKELNLASDIRHTIEIGLILAMQIDPSGDSKDILFGHQSFREFLVARYWYFELLRLTRLRKSREHREEITGRLGEARLMQDGDAAFSMLRGMLERLTDGSQRQQIHEWAQAVVDDENLNERRLRHDQSYILRESALSIGSSISPIVLEDNLSLRSLLAHHFFHRQSVTLHAPKLVAPNSFLSECVLNFANLEGANLVGVDLEGAKLAEANLQGANLRRARLVGANLRGTNLRGANLHQAHLMRVEATHSYFSEADLTYARMNRSSINYSDFIGAKMSRCNLLGASLRESDFTFANLDNAHLDGAILDGAQFISASLICASLRETNLRGANLKGANLEGANLCGANLRLADLEGANLKSTNLKGADLEGADLEGADLEGADLEGARLGGAHLDGINLKEAILQSTSTKTAPSEEHLSLQDVFVDDDDFSGVE